MKTPRLRLERIAGGLLFLGENLEASVRSRDTAADEGCGATSLKPD
jgi:hypothetical protein